MTFHRHIRLQTYLPIVGQLLAFARDPLGFLEQRAQTKEDVITLAMPTRPTLLLNRPDLVRQVLEERQACFSKTSSSRDVGGVFGHGVFTASGAGWLARRRLLHKAFTQDRIVDYANVALADLRERVAAWPDGAIDIHEEMNEFVLRTTPRVLFGLNPERSRALLEALGIVVERFRQEFPVPRSLSTILPAWLPTAANRRLHAAVRTVRRLATEALTERAASGAVRGDVLDLLLAWPRSDACEGRSLAAARDEVVTLLLTGHETTVSALTWMLWLISRDAGVQQRVALEAAALPGWPKIDAGALIGLRYAPDVVRESLRLMPTAWGMNRRCTRTTDLGTHRVRRGQYVAFSQWLMHRDPRSFEQPLAFRPERWATGAPPHGAYFPFGGGARRCLGERLALAELTVALTVVVGTFTVSPADREPPACDVSVTLAPRGPVQLVLTRR